MEMYNKHLKEAAVRRGKKTLEDLKITQMEIVRKDMKKLGMTSEVALYRNTWQTRIHKGNSK